MVKHLIDMRQVAGYAGRIICYRERDAIAVRSFIPLIVLLAMYQTLEPPYAHASPAEEGDQLYARALNAWDRSTSPEVEKLLRQALALQRSALMPTDQRIAQTLDRLGRVFFNRGVVEADPRQFEASLAWFREAVGLARQARSPDGLLLSDYVSDLAAAQREAGQPASALPNVCEGLRLRLSLSPLTIDRIARSLANLARTRAALGEQREANELLRDANAIQRTPSDGPSVGRRAFERNCEGALVS